MGLVYREFLFITAPDFPEGDYGNNSPKLMTGNDLLTIQIEQFTINMLANVNKTKSILGEPIRHFQTKLTF